VNELSELHSYLAIYILSTSQHHFQPQKTRVSCSCKLYIVLPPVWKVVGICKQIIILIIPEVTSRLKAHLKLIYSCIEISDVLVLSNFVLSYVGCQVHSVWCLSKCFQSDCGFSHQGTSKYIMNVAMWEHCTFDFETNRCGKGYYPNRYHYRFLVHIPNCQSESILLLTNFSVVVRIFIKCTCLFHTEAILHIISFILIYGLKVQINDMTPVTS
jgi:hypothetical protein